MVEIQELEALQRKKAELIKANQSGSMGEPGLSTPSPRPAAMPSSGTPSPPQPSQSAEPDEDQAGHATCKTAIHWSCSSY